MTSVVEHKGEEIGKGLLRSIERLGAVPRESLVEAMKAKARYVARFERDEDGWWVVHIDDVKGCHTQAKTIAQGKERIREALSLFIGEAAESVEIEPDVELPRSVRKAVAQSVSAREIAEAEAEKAARSTKRAVEAMLGLGLSTRDAGELLGLTRQRVHQLATGS